MLSAVIVHNQELWVVELEVLIGVNDIGAYFAVGRDILYAPVFVV